MKYRMEITASVMFTVEADSEAGALKKARDLIELEQDGLDLRLFPQEQYDDQRLYINQPDNPDYQEPQITDIFEE